MKSTQYLSLAALMFAGKAYGQFLPVIDLAQLHPANGQVIHGEQTDDYGSGQAAGDVNHDGIDDLIIGAGAHDGAGTNSGAAYVVFGIEGGHPSDFSLSDLDGSNGFVVYGAHGGECLGTDVTGGLDINDDGIDDVMIGAPDCAHDGNDFVGSSFVIFGKDTPFPAQVDVNQLTGADGFVIRGTVSNEKSGGQVMMMPDFNGDDLADMVISAPDRYGGGVNFNQGAIYVVFSHDNGYPAILDLSLLDGTNGFIVHGNSMDDELGRAISNGDFNGDGLVDLTLSGFNPDIQSGHWFGTTYVIFGDADPWMASFDLSTLDGTNGFEVPGIINYFNPPNDRFLENAMVDMNADGYDDLIIGYPHASITGSRRGVVFVVYGNQQTMPNALDLANLDGNNGFKMDGSRENEFLGGLLGKVGDVNDDGFSDLAIGSIHYIDPFTPKISAYVLFADATEFTMGYDPSTALNGHNGFKIQSINPSNLYGNTGLQAAGDFNADGVEDMLVSTTRGTTDNSAHYIIYGKGDLIFRHGWEP